MSIIAIVIAVGLTGLALYLAWTVQISDRSNQSFESIPASMVVETLFAIALLLAGVVVALIAVYLKLGGM